MYEFTCSKGHKSYSAAKPEHQKNPGCPVCATATEPKKD